MALSISKLVDEVRRVLDQATLDDNVAIYETTAADSFSSYFGDEDLVDRIMDGARYVAARVDSDILQELQSERTVTDETAFYPTISSDSDSTTWTNIPFYRLLQNRVTVNSNTAFRRTSKGNAIIEEMGQNADNFDPSYVYQDYRFYTPSGVSVDPTIRVVEVPVIDFNGTAYEQPLTQSVPLPELLREAVIQYTAMTCFLTRAQGEAANRAMESVRSELKDYRLPFRQITNTPEQETEAD